MPSAFCRLISNGFNFMHTFEHAQADLEADLQHALHIEQGKGRV